HGVPLGICQHHNELFLPWHRGYLYHFELALQDVDSEVTLPWWNWMDEEGIPPAFDAAEAGGRPNVLQSAAIEPLGVPHQDGWPDRTYRDTQTQDPGPLPPPLRKAVIGGEEVDLYKWMMAPSSYIEF